MGNSPLERKINKSAESRKLYAQEELILDTTEKLLEILEKKQLNKAKLAANLGHSAAYVTQLLDGSRNMTLRTLSDLAFALGSRVRVDFCNASHRDGWLVYDAQPIKMMTVTPMGQVMAANTGPVTRTIQTPSKYAVGI